MPPAAPSSTSSPICGWDAGDGPFGARRARACSTSPRPPALEWAPVRVQRRRPGWIASRAWTTTDRRCARASAPAPACAARAAGHGVGGVARSCTCFPRGGLRLGLVPARRWRRAQRAALLAAGGNGANEPFNGFLLSRRPKCCARTIEPPGDIALNPPTALLHRDHRQFRDALGVCARGNHAAGGSVGGGGEFPRELYRKAARVGLLGIGFPESTAARPPMCSTTWSRWRNSRRRAAAA